MAIVNEPECLEAGLSISEVTRIARGIQRYAEQASAIGLTVFGGTGSGSLRFDQNNGKGALIVADINRGRFDGGCGAEGHSDDGLVRGE